MNVQILFSYMTVCEELGITPTWKGLKEYKEFRQAFDKVA